MRYTFTKMHGLGNDFIILDGRLTPLTLTPSRIRQLANRRWGIGCDQLILLEAPKTEETSVFMRIFNANGGEVEACGNATRCVGHLLTLESGQAEHALQTVAGVLKTSHQQDATSVFMGAPQLSASELALTQEVDTLFLPIEIKTLERPVGVGMGNPHMIFFVEDADHVPLNRFGEELAKHPLYPKGTNVEFVTCLSRHHLRMRVWERGTGVTPACATGACASVVAGVRRGLLSQGDPIRVTLDGGDLTVTYDGKNIVMSGPVKLAFEGSFEGDSFFEEGAFSGREEAAG